MSNLYYKKLKEIESLNIDNEYKAIELRKLFEQLLKDYIQHKKTKSRIVLNNLIQIYKKENNGINVNNFFRLKDKLNIWAHAHKVYLSDDELHTYINKMKNIIYLVTREESQMSFMTIVNDIFKKLTIYFNDKNVKNKHNAKVQKDYEKNKWFFRIVVTALIFLIIIVFFKQKESFNEEIQYAVNIESSSKNDKQSTMSSMYTLKITSNPAKSKIQIMNIKPKYYPGIRLKSGRYSIRISKIGYITKRFYIHVNKNTLLNMTLKKTP